MIKAGLDIGNSKISLVVAEYKSSKDINILSLQSIPTNNIKKNLILNHENLQEQLKYLITETEKQSQTKLNSINLNCSLLNSSSYYYDSEIKINNEKISKLNLKKIINQSEYFNNNNYDKFEIFNNITSYNIDNNQYFSAPLGNYSDFIKINLQNFSSKKYINNLTSLLKKLNLVQKIVPSPLSSALSTTTDEKDLGTIYFNLGHTTSSI